MSYFVTTYTCVIGKHRPEHAIFIHSQNFITIKQPSSQRMIQIIFWKQGGNSLTS